MNTTIHSQDLIEKANKEGFCPRIHDQGDEESCIIHAFTSVHELTRRKHFVSEDLMIGSQWMKDIGALMMDIAKRLEMKGQTELREEGEGEGENKGIEDEDIRQKPKRRCRNTFKLACEQIQQNIS